HPRPPPRQAPAVRRLRPTARRDRAYRLLDGAHPGAGDGGRGLRFSRPPAAQPRRPRDPARRVLQGGPGAPRAAARRTAARAPARRHGTDRLHDAELPEALRPPRHVRRRAGQPHPPAADAALRRDRDRRHEPGARPRRRPRDLRPARDLRARVFYFAKILQALGLFLTVEGLYFGIRYEDMRTEILLLMLGIAA